MSRVGEVTPTFSLRARAAQKQRNETIVRLLAVERMTGEVITELAKVEGRELSRDSVQRLLHLLETEGRVRSRRTAHEKVWKAAPT